MTYEEAKVYKFKLESKNNADSEKLKEFQRLNNGLVPDHVRELPEYQTAKREFEKSFSELRNFNSWFMRVFKKEYIKDRRKRSL